MQASENLSRAHYRDAWLYERRYGRRKVDLPHYVGWVEAHPGRWLELGAGTGRVTLAIAARAREVVAVEREPALARRLRERAPENVSVQVADFTKLRNTTKFRGIVAPFNTFSHVFALDALQRLLERLHASLVSSGLLLFDVPMPQPSVLARDPERFYRVGHATGPDGTRYAYSESFDYDAVEQRLLVIARYASKRDTFVLPLLQRMHFPQELRFVIANAGFVILRHDGGFNGEPLTAESDSQVLVLKRV